MRCIAESEPAEIVMLNSLQSVSILFVLCMSVFLLSCDREQAARQIQIREVVVQEVRKQTVPLEVELSGRVSAFKKAEVRPQVGGILQRQLFTEGSFVREGQSLYKIDSAIYEAEVNSARAELNRALASFTQTDLKRKRRLGLLSSHAVSKQAVEDADAEYLQAKADVDLCRARLRTAEIRLQYTDVLAPITGRIGKSHKTQGSLVTANQDEPLAVIQQLDPVYVDLTRSSFDLLKWRDRVASGRLKHLRDDNIRVRLNLDATHFYATPGELKFADISVDESTGMILMRAVFPNPEGLLLPGMYVQAFVSEGTLQEAVLLPEKAVQRNARGRSSVLVLGKDDVVHERYIETDERVGQDIIVKGLEERERVIIEGFRGLKDGDRVRIAASIRSQDPK